MIYRNLKSISCESCFKKKDYQPLAKRKVLIERLVDDSKSNVVKPESKEEMNLAESAEFSSEVEIEEINSIRRKAKALQIDMDVK